jgi:hypothetical protein
VTSTEHCPQGGWPLSAILDLQPHVKAVERNDAHVAACYSLLGVDYARLRAEDRAHAEELARERGWRLL